MHLSFVSPSQGTGPNVQSQFAKVKRMGAECMVIDRAYRRRSEEKWHEGSQRTE